MTVTAISRSGGYEVYRFASNMPKSPKKRGNSLQAKIVSLLLRNQKETLKTATTWTESKPKGTTLKVQSIAIANSLYFDLIYKCYEE